MIRCPQCGSEKLDNFPKDSGEIMIGGLEGKNQFALVYGYGCPACGIRFYVDFCDIDLNDIYDGLDYTESDCMEELDLVEDGLRKLRIRAAMRDQNEVTSNE